MKNVYLILLLSLFVFSCGEKTEEYDLLAKKTEEYDYLAKNYEERCTANIQNEKIIDSLKKLISKLPPIDNVNTKPKTKLSKDELLQDEFFDNFDYVNYIQILPSTYFITTLKNGKSKNYICQWLESVDRTSSKFIYIPTNKTLFDVFENYNPDKATIAED